MDRTSTPRTPDPGPRAPLGFIGLGQIGTSLARHLLDGGYPLVVWNRTRSKAEAFAAEHAGRVTLAPSAAALGGLADRIVVCLLDDAAVAAVFAGPEGLAAGLRPGAVVLNFTTVHPDTSRRMADLVEARGAGYVDSTFSGSAEDAAQGTLTLMVGGEPVYVEKARDLLDFCGDPVFHLGPPGAGSLAKVLNNGLAATCLAASGEAVAAARRAGLDPARFIQVLLASSGSNYMLEHVHPRLLNPRRGPVETTHTLRRFRDYTRLATELAAQRGLPQSVAAAADGVYRRSIEAGLGEEQFTSFIVAFLEE